MDILDVLAQFPHVELKSLVGPHVLDAVDMNSSTLELLAQYNPELEIASTMSFRLDGVVYVALEDPDDGYRSYLRRLIVCEQPMKNVSPPCDVVGVYAEGMDDRVSDIVNFIDVVTGQVVLGVGTDNTDDYYPYCVMYWKPENMAINKGKV